MMAPEHCASLHGFLLAIPFIETLHEMQPALGGRTMEETYGISKLREGYELCMANIISLANRGATNVIQSPFVDVSKHDERVPPEEATAAQ